MSDCSSTSSSAWALRRAPEDDEKLNLEGNSRAAIDGDRSSESLEQSIIFYEGAKLNDQTDKLLPEFNGIVLKFSVYI